MDVEETIARTEEAHERTAWRQRLDDLEGNKMARGRCFWKNGQGGDTDCDLIGNEYTEATKERRTELDDMWDDCGKHCPFWSPIPTFREIEKRREMC